jgi:glycosyltransferase involved in cell wall biosynthesis
VIRKAIVGVRRLATVAPWLVRAAASRRPARPKGNRILMLTISSIEYDPRVNKVAMSLAERGYEVEILAPARDAHGAEREVVPGVRYVLVPRRWLWRFFLVYQEEFRRAALGRTFDYVHANDLTTLTVGWVLARTRGVPLVYDAHELWTENVQPGRRGWAPMSPPVHFAADRWERYLLRSVDLLVTVGPSIADEFRRRNGRERPPLLLPNYPSLALLAAKPSVPSIREACGLDDGHFVTLYLGGVNALRNIETVIRAHRRLPENHVFVVRGPGVAALAGDYRALARAEGVEDRVFFLPPVGRDDVIAAAAGADCGIVMLRNICRNFFLFYPNKLFEYALAGLPVAVSNFPDVSSFVEAERCGVTFDPDSPESIASALLTLSADPAEARASGARGRASILERHNWESAVEELIARYRSLA